MVTVAVIGITAGIAIPSFTAYLPHLRLNGAARDLISDLRYARSLAVGQNKKYKLVFNAANESYTIRRTTPDDEIRKTDYKDTNQNYKGIEILSVKDNSGDDISIIEFDYNGTATADGNTDLPAVITIQRSDGSETKKIDISRFGRIYAE
jgi:Tfp pilus assembly protein FimT